jgi:hypothetical protein
MFLGQAEHLEMKMDDSGGSRPKRGWVAWPGWGTTPPVPIWPPGLVSLTSSPPGSYHGKILTPEKSQVNLSPGRSMKRNAKQGFPVLQSYNQNKGGRWKIPIKHYKT